MFQPMQGGSTVRNSLKDITKAKDQPQLLTEHNSNNAKYFINKKLTVCYTPYYVDNMLQENLA